MMVSISSLRGIESPFLAAGAAHDHCAAEPPKIDGG